MTQGATYLILFYTDGNSYSMVDPEISVSLYDPGQICSTAMNVTSASFPYQLTGTFDDDPSPGGSCDPTPNNAVWFQFTPTATASYQVSAQNHSTTDAYSRLAVFESASCQPYGAQQACVTAGSKTISTNVTRSQGMPYLILFHTDGESYTMVDPELTIQ